MKIDPSHLEKLTPDQLRSAEVALVHGSDVGLTAEVSNALIEKLDIAKDDPFHFVEVDEDTFKANPASLSDEMDALSFDGGHRVVYMRLSQERIATQVNAHLEKRTESSGQNTVMLLIKSVPLKATNPLRKRLEKTKSALALNCEPDNTANLKTVIQQTLHKEGLTIQNDALSVLLEEFGDDRAYTRNELEKLALLKSGSKDPITLEDVSSVIAVQNNATLFEIARAVTARDPQKVEALLNKAFAQGESPVAIVRTVLRFMERQKGPARGGADPISILYETEKRLKSTNYPDIAVCRQALAKLSHR